MTFVGPTLEYASLVWATQTKTDRNQWDGAEESCQFVQRDYRRRTSSVTAMHENLCWDTLQQCRHHARLSMMYCIVHHIVDIRAKSYLFLLPSRTRGHEFLHVQFLCKWANFVTFWPNFRAAYQSNFSIWYLYRYKMIDIRYVILYF